MTSLQDTVHFDLTSIHKLKTQMLKSRRIYLICRFNRRINSCVSSRLCCECCWRTHVYKSTQTHNCLYRLLGNI